MIFGILLLAIGLFLLSGWQNAVFSAALAAALGRKLGQTWPFYLQIFGLGLAICGAGLAFWQPIGLGWNRLAGTVGEVLSRLDVGLKNRLGAALDFSEFPIEWPRFNRL